MTVWLYKATEKLVRKEVTQTLAMRGFLCRSPNEISTGKPARRVADVKLGDVIHFYCIEKGKALAFGKFEVITKDRHKSPAWFGELWEGTALYVVADDSFITSADRASSYTADPKVGAMTGWVLDRVGPAMPYDSKRFKVYETLVEVPEA